MIIISKGNKGSNPYLTSPLWNYFPEKFEMRQCWTPARWWQQESVTQDCSNLKMVVNYGCCFLKLKINSKWGCWFWYCEEIWFKLV